MMDAPDRDTALFARLALMLHAAAMQYMGKVKNPVTDKVERDLPAAQGMIDTLAMLERRMKGNLPHDEANMLAGILQELRLNYVDEVQKPEPPPPKGEGGAS